MYVSHPYIIKKMIDFTIIVIDQLIFKWKMFSFLTKAKCGFCMLIINYMIGTKLLMKMYKQDFLRVIKLYGNMKYFKLIKKFNINYHRRKIQTIFIKINKNLLKIKNKAKLMKINTLG